MLETAFATSLIALVAALIALRHSAAYARKLAAEHVQLLSAAESAGAELRLLSDRVGAVEQRIGRARRLTPAKRDRAMELLAHGASEAAVARELEMRESEVAVLARLRNTVGA